MYYPHVRVAAPGRVEYFETAQEYAADANWTEREETGWVRTEGIDPEIIHQCDDTVHLAGGWIRLNADGESILENRVVYVLVRSDNEWGVQARFACGSSKIWHELSDEHAMTFTCDRLLRVGIDDRINFKDCFRLPVVVVNARSVERWNAVATLQRTLAASLGEASTIQAIRLIHNGHRGANVAVSLRSQSGDTRHVMFLIAKHGPECRLAAMSLIVLPGD